MGICPTLDFHRNFPLTQLLNIRAFPSHREPAFLTHIFWVIGLEMDFSWQRMELAPPQSPAHTPEALHFVPWTWSWCQSSQWVARCKHRCSSLLHSLPGQRGRKDPTKQSSSGKSFLQSNAAACIWDEGKQLPLVKVTHHSNETPHV